MINAADSEVHPADRLSRLPNKTRLSLGLVLVVAGLNAFNDNILKMMLVGLAPKVVAGSLGHNIGAWLGGMILLPYVIFAPLAGYFSDRYSKRNVIAVMLVAQALILLLAGACFESAMGVLSIALALGTFFLLAMQATFFSPSKSGILKELAGSRRLGAVAGWLQLVTMVGILGGLWLGGNWFDALFARHGDPWKAAAQPIWILFGLAIIALLAGFLIQRTPSHPQTPFRKELLWEHFAHLAETLRLRGIRRACFGNAAYWFVASMAGAMFVDIGILLHPDTAAGGAASAASTMTFMVGVGTVAGSVFVSWVNKRGLQLGIVPLAAVGLAVALFCAGLTVAGTSPFDWALISIGFMGGCYLVPIQAYLQDRADPAKRGSVLSAVNLLDSIAGVLAVAFLVLLKKLGLSYHGQFCVLGILILVASMYMLKILPQDVLRFVAIFIVRLLYRVRAVDGTNLPKSGPVLLLPNHMSYMDAFIIGAACERHVRFVMWDQLYNIKSVRWALRILGTVPISASRAKDAIRSVAAALKEGEVVCLFPEGQITRHGMINELRKGYELMARQGEARVVPAHLDGLFGSMFSYKSGIVFKKWPKKLRFPVSVRFGKPLPAREADAETVRLQMLALSSAAFLDRNTTATSPGTDPQIKANALRLLDIEWVRKGNTLLCLSGVHSPVGRTIECYASLDETVKNARVATELAAAPADSVVVIGAAQELPVTDLSAWRDRIRFVCCWDVALTEANRLELEAACGMPILPGLLDLDTSALISVSLPDPEMPVSERGGQRGTWPGSFGRLLPGLAVRKLEQGLEIRGLRPGSDILVTLPGITLSDNGFLVPISDPIQKPSSLPE